jgi:hypothetical protein
MAMSTLICLLDVLKCDFGVVYEEVFEGDEKPCEIIFCIMGIQ